ncbi:hypothetical protein NQT62_11340 [Limnobacter humi]|uniref:Uncharacterized protein n=1 Tax=Limnobacter humi TaxID=1778671 RepID=A0ABT1WHN4_9BURK|nr:hypothetical protein [Limnobacter humi]MCQ8897027.1 hypothetical protein [Limnobacter humi]
MNSVKRWIAPVLLGVALLQGCVSVDRMDQVAYGFLLKTENGDVKEIDNLLALADNEKRESLVRKIYGDDAKYLSQAQVDDMFSNTRSFILNLLGGKADELKAMLIEKAVELLPDDKGVNTAYGKIALNNAQAKLLEDLLGLLDFSKANWEKIKALNIQQNKAAIDERVDLLKQRYGDAGYKLLEQGDPQQFRRLVSGVSDKELIMVLTDDDAAKRALNNARIASFDQDYKGNAMADFNAGIQNLGPVIFSPTSRIGS